MFPLLISLLNELGETIDANAGLQVLNVAMRSMNSPLTDSEAPLQW